MKFYILLSFFLGNTLSSAPSTEEEMEFLLESDEIEQYCYLPVEKLEERLEEQDYDEVLKILFSLKERTHKQQALAWAKEHAKEGHVPLMYFIFITIFDRNDRESIIESLYLYICSIFIVNMDLACFNGIYSDEIPSYLDINIVKSFENCYMNELCTVIKTDLYLKAYERALSFLKDKTDYPDPAWIGSYCGRTFRKRPGLKFKPVTETIKASFFTDPDEIEEKRRLAYNITKDLFDRQTSHMLERKEKYRKVVSKLPFLKCCL